MQRYNVVNLFLALPTGFLRALASKKVPARASARARAGRRRAARLALHTREGAAPTAHTQQAAPRRAMP